MPERDAPETAEHPITRTTGGASKPATAAIIAQQQLAETLPFADRQDFEDAHRGFGVLDEPDPDFAIVTP